MRRCAHIVSILPSLSGPQSCLRSIPRTTNTRSMKWTLRTDPHPWWVVPLSATTHLAHLRCPVCQSLSVDPVRIARVATLRITERITRSHPRGAIAGLRRCHVSRGRALRFGGRSAVRCGACYDTWCEKNPGERHCVLCRGRCDGDESTVVPDRLLGRIVGHLPVRCLHCQSAQTVDTMVDHLRRCAPHRAVIRRRCRPPPEVGTAPLARLEQPGRPAAGVRTHRRVFAAEPCHPLPRPGATACVGPLSVARGGRRVVHRTSGFGGPVDPDSGAARMRRGPRRINEWLGRIVGHNDRYGRSGDATPPHRSHVHPLLRRYRQRAADRVDGRLGGTGGDAGSTPRGDHPSVRRTPRGARSKRTERCPSHAVGRSCSASRTI